MSESELTEQQIQLLRRLYAADKQDASALHDFNDLMGDLITDPHDGWFGEAYEDFQTLGYLHRASGQTFGGPFGRLSSRGRWYVESLPPQTEAPEDGSASPEKHPAHDDYFRFQGGTVIVRTPTTDDEVWLLTWLPDAEDDPAYPGFTLSPDSADFPTGLGVGGVLQWAAAQPWVRRAAGEDVEPESPESATPLGVPADEYAAFSKRVHAEFGFQFAATPEPDGSWSWAVLAEDGLTLRSGVANTWADALLEAVAGLAPPSGEQ